MEPLWSPVVATAGNQRQIDCVPNPQKEAKSVAIGCHRLRETFMVRRGSTVRVRQRALQRPRKAGLLSARLARSPACGRYGALNGAFRSKRSPGTRSFCRRLEKSPNSPQTSGDSEPRFIPQREPRDDGSITPGRVARRATWASQIRTEAEQAVIEAQGFESHAQGPHLRAALARLRDGMEGAR
jgi:hypothetical protein